MSELKQDGLVKKLAKRWFIDAFTGMAQGLFVTLIAGTIIKTVGTLFGDNNFGNFLKLAGQIASVLMGAGIGAGIATYLKAPKMVVFAAIVAGFIGAFSSQVLGAQYVGGAITDITPILAKGLPGNPIGAYICALAATEVGMLVCGKTKLDILIVPLTCILVAMVGCYVAWPFIYLINLLSDGIALATDIAPFFMGIIIAVSMGVLLTMPTSSAAIWVTIAMANTSDAMLIAGGAAVVGCSCQMIGFAVQSFRDNGISGLISQGLGTSMLQIPNIMKKPVIFVPPILASAVLGPVSTCLFKLRCNASGGGMGTSGLVGVIGTIEASNGVISTPAMVIGIILLLFILPAALTFGFYSLFRVKGIISDGDMKL